jgi:hypothetical protein
MKDIHEFTRDWYGRLEDLTEELEENGFKVEEANSEYITVYGGESTDDKDIYHTLRLGGTERTITVDRIDTELV